MTKKTYLMIIICVSLLTHFLFFGQPKETVFDEVHFGKFISGYFTHEYFFDIHPPLGKLLISGMGYLTGFRPGFSFENIGQGFPDKAYLWLRLLPMLAGTLLPIVIFFLIRRLKISDLAAFAGAMFVVLENALLVQSRFILLDSFLLLFGFLSLLCYLKYKNGSHSTFDIRHSIFLFLAGLFAALAVSVKWTGATFLALIVLLELIQISKRIRKNYSQQASHGSLWAYGLTSLLALVIIPIVIYFSIFALHFSLLNKSGPGDAFMTPEFRKTLVDSNDHADPAIQPLNIFEKFKELNIQMYKSNATLTATHPYSSQWYTWPSMTRPIYYWNGSAPSINSGQAGSPQAQPRIYLLGNPVVWWAATVAILYMVISLLWHILRLAMSKILKSKDPEAGQARYGAGIAGPYNWIPWFLGGAFILNLLPFIGIKRAMFLYHYFPALIFSIIALVCLVDKLPNKKKVFLTLLAASTAAFIFFAPLTYGLSLTEKTYYLRIWLNSWI